MQDRYAGDVGDYQKFGLLRLISHGEGEEPLRLGVNWYLVADESHNGDGKHISYLDPMNRSARSLATCDRDLYERLRTLIAGGRRTVRDLESSGVLPAATVTFDIPLRPAMSRDARRRWHAQSLESLASTDVVFLDPDNGISADHRRSNRHKFVLIDEIADYLRRGQSVVVYQHADRSRGGVPVQVQRRMLELRDATGVEPLGTVVARRGSCRLFIVLPARRHRRILERALESHSNRWRPHTELWPFEGNEVGRPGSDRPLVIGSADRTTSANEIPEAT